MGKRAAGTPVAKLSREAQADRLRARALALQNQGMMEELMVISKPRPDLVPLLLQHAYSLGAPRVNSAKSAASGVQPGSVVTSSCAMLHDSAAESDNGSLGGSSGFKRGDVQPVIPRCFQTWASCPPQYFVHLLSGAEPISLSAAALKSLSPNKSKHIPKKVLLELWERMTNLDPEESIVPAAARSVECLAVDIFNAERGRPMRDIRLPPQWSRDGCFFLKIDSLGAQATKRSTSETVGLPDTFLQTVVDRHALVIQRNYSERHACVCDPNGFATVPMITLFPVVARMRLVCGQGSPVLADVQGATPSAGASLEASTNAIPLARTSLALGNETTFVPPAPCSAT